MLGTWWILGKPETTIHIAAAIFLANLIVPTSCLAFVLRKMMQADKDPGNVSLRLAPLNL
jgi:hypothetical protein